MNSNPCWLMVRLALLLGVLLVQSSEEATYQSFLNSHVDPAGPGNTNPNAYCDREMMRRGLTRPRCKPSNTFILSNANSVKQVCRGRRVRGNIFESRSRFRLVHCRHTGGSPPNGCRYRGRRQSKKIRLGCVNNLPVHFQP